MARRTFYADLYTGSAPASVITIYSDAAATVPADIQTLAGVAVTNSQLTVGYDRHVRFLGPADGTATLYTRASTNTALIHKMTATDYQSTAQTTDLGSSTSSGTSETVNTVAASGAAVTLPDVTTATIHDVTLTANCTLTFPTPAAGKSFTLRLTQDATGGRTVTWPTVRWPSAVPPVPSTGAGKSDLFTFLSISGTAWNGLVAAQDIR